MPEPDTFYRVKAIRRIRCGKQLFKAGEVISVAPGSLRVACFWCRNGLARPADAATARDIELFDLMVRALPVGVP